MIKRRGVAILGSTGSIGESAFRVLRELPELFDVVALVSRNRVERLAEQALALGAKRAVATDESRYEKLRSLLPPGVECAAGDAAMVETVLRPDVDLVLCAVVGTGGLLPVIEALKAGKTVALASKEVMVMAGEIVRRYNRQIVPVDSEHSAIFQCLAGRAPEEVKNLILTASGGAFRDWTREQIAQATWESALAHPTWSMGPKVTIDSASMMNKALELVEAHFLFDIPSERLKTVIHPQSVVHSMVEFVDGSLMAQMSHPDMRFAIQYALTYPNRVPGNLPELDFSKRLNLSFETPDPARYPSLGFAAEAMRRGGTLPAVMNAANEVAVEKFRENRIAFPAIWSIIERTMEKHDILPASDLMNILAADQWAREFAGKWNG